MSVDFGPLNDAVLGVFAESVTLVVGAAEISGIYDSRHYEIEDGIAGGSALLTIVSVAESDAAGLVAGLTELTARGLRYRVKDKRPDGGGMVAVDLERVDA